MLALFLSFELSLFSVCLYLSPDDATIFINNIFDNRSKCITCTNSYVMSFSRGINRVINIIYSLSFSLSFSQLRSCTFPAFKIKRKGKMWRKQDECITD